MNSLKLIPFICMGSLLGITSFEKEEIRTKKLLTTAVKTFEKKSIAEACSLFSYAPRWKIEPQFIIVGNLVREGVKLVDQLRPDAIWNKFIAANDFFNVPIVQKMLTAHEPMWIDFYRFDKLFHVHVKVVEKNKTNYIVGVGFFPEDKDYLAKLLINAVIDNIQKTSVIDVANIVNNIQGRLVIGDVFATIIDTDGLCWAHGKNHLLVGQNLLQTNQKDLYERILKKVNDEKKTTDIFDYEKKNVTYKIFLKTSYNKENNRTFIIITQFCPSITEKTLITMAETIAGFLQKSNKGIFDKINTSESTRESLITHELSAIIIDKKTGTILAGTEPQFYAELGRNFYQYYDKKQQPIGKMIKELANENSTGFFSQFSKNILERIYYQNVETPYGSFVIIVNGYFPYKNEELAPIIVDDTILYLKSMHNFAAFDYLGEEASPFLIGDVTLKILNQEGFYLVDGTQYETIWTQDKTLAKAPEGWIIDQRKYPRESYQFRKFLPQFLGQPDHLIIGASYTKLIH